MSRFTLKALRMGRIRIVSKYDPAIDWEAMNAAGVYFSDPPEGGEVYDGRKHTQKVASLEGMTPIVFYCLSPTTKQRLTAFELAGIDVDSQTSAVVYVGPAGGSAKYSAGNGTLLGLTSAQRSLGLFCILDVDGVEVQRIKNKFGLLELAPATLAELAPLGNDGEPCVDFLDPIFEEIGGYLMDADESNAGN